MSRLIMVGAGLVALLLVIGFIYLVTADIPAPSQPVERTLPDDRFPK